MTTPACVKKTFIATATLITLGLPLLPTTAHATPSELHYMVSPVSCHPASSTDAGKLSLTNGAWTFNANQYELANLVCPISFSGDAATISTVILSYRDTFNVAGSENGYVQANFKFRNRSSSGSSTAFSSASTDGSETEYGYHVLTSQDNSDLSQHPSLGNIYYLHVKLYRKQNANGEVAFTGYEIRF